MTDPSPEAPSVRTIVALLRRHGPMTARRLWQRCDHELRTVQAAIRTAERHGLTTHTVVTGPNPGGHGGWRGHLLEAL